MQRHHTQTTNYELEKNLLIQSSVEFLEKDSKMLGLILLAVLFVAVYWYIYKSQYPPNFPPGPRNPIPFIGDLFLSVGYDNTSGFQKMHAKYGPVVGLNMVGYKLISIADLNIMQEALSSDTFSARPLQEGFNFLRGGTIKDGTSPGLLSSSGENWKDMRRFTLKTLRDFGLGKRTMEDILWDEANHLTRTIAESNGEPIETINIFSIPILNAIWRILTGERLEARSPKLNKTLYYIEKLIADGGNTVSFIAFTSSKITKLFEKLGIMCMSKAFEEMYKIIDAEIADHEVSFQKDNMRDFLDCFLDQKIFNGENEQERIEAKHNLRSIFVDLFLAGSETTSSTLKWGILFMALNPDIQKKVQDEIDKEMGNCISNDANSVRLRMPYCEAVLLELQRRGNVVPLALLHATAIDTTLGQYKIPKDTMVIPNLTCVLMDPKVFPEPLKFKPERFIDANGCFLPHPSVVPFGVGKHRCLGENLAKSELFIFFTSMMQKFTIIPEDPNNLPTTHYRAGVTLSPHNFKARFVPRN